MISLIRGRIPESDILAVEGNSLSGLLLLEALSSQTNFLSADLTRYHLRVYIFIVSFFLNSFPCGMFSCNILGCSFLNG